MPRTNSDATTVVPILRDDGTVYFEHTGGRITERLWQWGVGFLWFLVVAVIISTLMWI